MIRFVIARGGGECLQQVIVGPHRERRGICISLNRTPAGVALSHWGQINRAIIRLNTPHFTASCSFAVKHCCTLRPQGMSDWQGLFWFGYVRVQSCWRVHLQLLLYRYHLKSVNPIWWYCAYSFLHSFMIVELHRANSTILRKLKSWSCAIHFAVYVLQYNCFSFANVMHLFL